MPFPWVLLLVAVYNRQSLTRLVQHLTLQHDYQHTEPSIFPLKLVIGQERSLLPFPTQRSVPKRWSEMIENAQLLLQVVAGFPILGPNPQLYVPKASVLINTPRLHRLVILISAATCALLLKNKKVNIYPWNSSRKQWVQFHPLHNSKDAFRRQHKLRNRAGERGGVLYAISKPLLAS